MKESAVPPTDLMHVREASLALASPQHHDESQDSACEIPMDYIALSFAKKRIGADSLRYLQGLATRELSYEEILALAQIPDFAQQKEFILRLSARGPSVPKTPIKLTPKYLTVLTNLFTDQEVSQKDFENLIEHGLGGKIVGTRSNKKRITLYQHFRNNNFVGFIRNEEVTHFKGLDENDLVKKISFSVEPPHSRDGSKSGLYLYPALREINKKKLECFGIVP